MKCFAPLTFGVAWLEYILRCRCHNAYQFQDFVAAQEKTRYTLIFGKIKVSAELVSIKREQNTENRITLSQTDVILSPFGQTDFNMK